MPWTHRTLLSLRQLPLPNPLKPGPALTVEALILVVRRIVHVVPRREVRLVVFPRRENQALGRVLEIVLQERLDPCLFQLRLERGKEGIVEMQHVAVRLGEGVRRQILEGQVGRPGGVVDGDALQIDAGRLELGVRVDVRGHVGNVFLRVRQIVSLGSPGSVEAASTHAGIRLSRQPKLWGGK